MKLASDVNSVDGEELVTIAKWLARNAENMQVSYDDCVIIIEERSNMFSFISGRSLMVGRESFSTPPKMLNPNAFCSLRRRTTMRGTTPAESVLASVVLVTSTRVAPESSIGNAALVCAGFDACVA